MNDRKHRIVDAGHGQVMIGSGGGTLAHLVRSRRLRGLENDRDSGQALVCTELMQWVEPAAVRNQAIQDHEIECYGRIAQDNPGFLQIRGGMETDSRLGAEMSTSVPRLSGSLSTRRSCALIMSPV